MSRDLVPNYVMEESDQARAKYGVASNALCIRLYNFPINVHEPQAKHREFLTKHVVPHLVSKGAVAYIVGHASRSGSDAYNQTLSEKRAAAVHAHLKFFVSLDKQAIRILGTGETEVIGKGSEDPRDRAVVLVVQDGGLPAPFFLPEIPKYEPILPDIPLGSLTDSGWRITGISGGQFAVPLPVPGGFLSLGGSKQTIEMCHLANGVKDREVRFSFLGVLLSLSPPGYKMLGPVGKMIERLGKMLKGKSGGLGPSSFPTIPVGSVWISPMMKRPVQAKSFAGFGLLGGPSLSAIFQGSFNVLIFSDTPPPMNPSASPEFAVQFALWLSKVKAVGSFMSTGLAVPGGSLDAAGGPLTLESDTPIGP